MKIMRVIDKYIKFKQALGMSFKSEAAILKAFGKGLNNIEITRVSSKFVQKFLYGTGPVTKTWFHKFCTLRVFYRFAISRGYVSSSPLPLNQPMQPPPHVPYIYTCDELRCILQATKFLINRKRSLPQDTIRIFLLFLYGTGLRLSEAISLTLRDVDLSQSLITVSKTKFYKSRIVPVGDQLCNQLQKYKLQRLRLSLPKGEDSAFFSTLYGLPIEKRCIQLNFERLCELTGVKRNDQSRHHPCLHDLRHTFAVHRLTTWYRSGSDVQQLLPYLSTYLGHIGISSTQRYLSMTQDLLKEANKRFEQYALLGGAHVE